MILHSRMPYRRRWLTHQSGTAIEALYPHVLQVAALSGCRVLHIACGVWHSAAVAAHSLGVQSLRRNSSEVDPAEWDALQKKMADAYRVLDEVRIPVWTLRCRLSYSIGSCLTPAATPGVFRIPQQGSGLVISLSRRLSKKDG